jgi:branched-chain amino acid aminotransferase
MAGDCVFELVRTFRQKPFKLDEHLERLFNSLQSIRLNCGLTLQMLRDAVLRLLDMNLPFLEEEDDYSILMDVTRGEFPLIRHSQPSPLVLISCMPVSDLLCKWAKYYMTGTHVVTPQTRHIPSQCLDPRVKHRSRLHFILADKEAKLVDPEAFGLLLDLDGRVTEILGANFFVVTKGRIRTPAAGNILMGITRATVLELAEELGIPGQECDLRPYDVFTADEAFQTSSPYCIFPVTKYNGLAIGNGQPGAITSALTEQFKKRVQCDFVEQAIPFMERARMN